MSVPSSFVEVRGRLLSMVFFFSVGAGRMEERKMRIGSFVVRCYEFDRMLAFWREALHYVPREPAQGGWVVLHDPEGRGPNVSLERFPEPLEHIEDQQGAPGPLHERPRWRGGEAGWDRGDPVPARISP